LYAVKVELAGTTFLHVGSAGFLENELAGHACDVLLLCAAAWKNTPDYPERIIEIVRPSCVVPIHYDDFTRPLSHGEGLRVLRSADLANFIKRLEATSPGMEIRLLEPCAETIL
jgi:L-ascorbate metabolism protein UlaG (beta-lactamase superfamily)